MAEEILVADLPQATQQQLDDAANLKFLADSLTGTAQTVHVTLAQIQSTISSSPAETIEYNHGDVATATTVNFAVNGPVQKLRAIGNVVIAFTAPATAGWITLAIHQDATGGRAITLPAFANGVPYVNTYPSGVTIIHAYYDGSAFHLNSLVKDSAFITDWGAKTSLANNSPYVQAMIDAGVKHIKIPSGTFKGTATLSVASDGVTIEGVGASSVWELTTGNDVAIDFNGGSAATRLVGCGVKNLWIRGEGFSGSPVEPSSTATGVGVMARHVAFFEMTGCIVSHCSGNGVYLLDSRMTEVSSNVFFENYWNTAWSYGGGSDIYTADDDEGLVIQNNFLCSNNKLGVFLLSNNEASSILIDGNIVIPVDDNGSVLADAAVKRSHGIGLFYGNASSTINELGRMVVSDNVIHKTRWNGIYASCDNATAPDTGGRFLITGNHCARNGIDHMTGDDPLQGGIVVLGGRDVQVIANQVVDYLGYSSTDGGNTGYGAINVYQQHEGANLQIVDNLVSKTPCNGIYVGTWAGRADIRGNRLYEIGDAATTASRGIYCYSTQTPRAALTSVSVADSGDLISKAGHGLSNGDRGVFATTANGLDKNLIYYVVNANVNDFQVSLTPGGTPVAITSDGSGHTFSDYTELGGHHIAGNRIQAWNGAIYYSVANGSLPPVIESNVLHNLRVADFAGAGIQVTGQEGHVRNNFCSKFLYGVHFSSAITGRRTESISIDGNNFDACGYGIRADNDGSGNGLVLACNNTFDGSSVRIYATTTAVVEGRRLGNGNIEAWLPAAPTFGTWKQYDVVKNSEWQAAEAIDWVKTDAGEELFSAATFTARNPA